MTTRCDQCAHWNPSVSEPAGFGECEKATPLWDATEWGYEADEMRRVLLPGFENQMLFAQDASDYRASVITRADFFCAHHERKPA